MKEIYGAFYFIKPKDSEIETPLYFGDKKKLYDSLEELVAKISENLKTIEVDAVAKFYKIDKKGNIEGRGKIFWEDKELRRVDGFWESD